NPPKVIITSAYEKYALKGYELDVADYLLKPIPFERFMKAVDKIYHLLERESAVNTDEYIFVKSDKQLKKIFIEDILFVESLENYVTVYTATSKEVVYSTMKLFSGSLPADRFLQVHRSYVVNIRHIKSIEGNTLHVASHEIPVARNLREQVFDVILSNRLISRI
ncbi:MAG: LytTR family DNA-binding domain-containing protein, partial [Tannerella sp.]|nr:LytTR family DNA-binding domain-containing protein [Tannerella sp.]